MKNSNRTQDRLELEEVAFHEKVRQGYLTLIEEEPNRFVCVDASQTEDEVFQDVWNVFEKRV